VESRRAWHLAALLAFALAAAIHTRAWLDRDLMQDLREQHALGVAALSQEQSGDG